METGPHAPATTNMKKSNEPRTLTEAQINANRENAKKSTGPRTAEGKAASSRNRFLHGLRANKHILLDEDPEEFLFLLNDLFDRFQPAGDGEEKLVLRIASDQWRLDRSLPMEAGIYRERLESVAASDYTRKRGLVNHKRNHELEPGIVPPPPPLPDEGDRLARAFDVDCDGPNSLAKLARYEGSIERSIDRCLRQLEKYQAARKAPTPNPGRQPSQPSGDPLQPETSPQDAAQPPEDDAQNAAPSAATPSTSGNYHSNPKYEGIAQSGIAALVLVMCALLHAMPSLVAHALLRAASPLLGTREHNPGPRPLARRAKRGLARLRRGNS